MKNITELMFNETFEIDSVKQYDILMTFAKGLENIVLEELKQILDKFECLLLDNGKILIRISTNIRSLLQLRCVDNLYLCIGTLAVGKKKTDLAEVTQSIEKMEFASLNKLLNEKGSYSFAVKAGRQGKHNFSRFDLEKAIENGIKKKRRFCGSLNGRIDLEFRCDLKDDKGMLSLKLTSPVFRFRQDERSFSVGAIRPTIAHSLVWLSDVRKKDVFYDPCCGSGTILSERAFYSGRKIIGTDISPDAVEHAKQNCDNKAIIYLADATNTILKDNSVDKIVSNIPWDEQVKIDDLFDFYYRLLKEFLRVTRIGGKIILFTDKEEALVHATGRCNVNLEKIATVSLHGLRPSIFMISKN